jgi:tetratricopeptide (TPR) repeat protein
MSNRISFTRRITYIICGLFLSLIFLEAGLRIGGAVFLTLNEFRNVFSIRQKGVYRIMCLGESTTLGSPGNSYPLQLEKILNQRDIGIKFSVINKGMSGANTTFILSKLEEDLNKYRPDMVIAMMGINDRSIKYYEGIPNANNVWFKRLGIYRLTGILWKFAVNKGKGADSNGAGKERVNVKLISLPSFASIESLKKPVDTIRLTKSSGLHPMDRTIDQERGFYYIEQGNYSFAEGYFRKMVESRAMTSKDDRSKFDLNPEKKLRIEECLKKTQGLNLKNDYRYQLFGWFYASQGGLFAAQECFKKAIEISPENSSAYEGLGWLYSIKQWNFFGAQECFKKAIEISPENSSAYEGLGWLYINQGDYLQAQECFKKAIKIDPQNGIIYLGLGRSYAEQSKPILAEESYKKAMELETKNDYIYWMAGGFYRSQNNFPKAEEANIKAIEINPLSVTAYVELGRCYYLQKKYLQAEEYFKKAIEIDPSNYYAYEGLEASYYDQKKYQQAEESYKKAIALDLGNDDRDYARLGVLYEEMGKRDLAEEYYSKINEFRLKYCNPVTYHNYQALKRILDQRGIRLVCAQYPIRDINLLKRMFQGRGKVIFVDNARIFKEAVKKSGCGEYFTDMFAGDFGHCTAKGNWLLAENIANTILKEIFGK